MGGWWVCALAAVLATIGGVAGCTPDHRPGLPPDSPFAAERLARPSLSSGVASGDVTADSAIVWFRTTGRALAQVSTLPESGQGRLVHGALIETAPDHDFTAHVTLTGLEPETRYRYWVRLASPDARSRFDQTAREAGSGWFQTAPLSTRSVPVTLVWSGDLGGQKRCRAQDAGYAILDRVADVRASFVLLLGDLVYSDDRCPSPPNLPGGDFVAATLDEYRAKHRYQREDPALQRMLARQSVYAIWDDHEVLNNFAGPHEPRMPIGRQALQEYWPISVQPEDKHRLYRSVRWGHDVELFILDTRSYRDKNTDPDRPGKTMLGVSQRQWLLAGLTQSTATWKLIATSVPLANTKSGSLLRPGNDSWARGADGTGFQQERDSILQHILRAGIRNVVWLAGDVHFAQVNDYDPTGDSRPDFREFICGPLSAAPGRLVAPEPTFNPITHYSESGFANFGVVTVDGATLHLEIRDEAGMTRFAKTFPADVP